MIDVRLRLEQCCTHIWHGYSGDITPVDRPVKSLTDTITIIIIGMRKRSEKMYRNAAGRRDTLYTRMCLWRWRRCRRRQQYRVLLGASATSSSNGLDRFDVVKRQRGATAEGVQLWGREGASRRMKRTSCLTATI